MLLFSVCIQIRPLKTDKYVSHLFSFNIDADFIIYCQIYLLFYYFLQNVSLLCLYSRLMVVVTHRVTFKLLIEY